MESRANHLLIGSFVLLVVLGIFAFVIWVARVQISGTADAYEVYFEEAVTGLGVGGEVRYRGIRVGEIIDIRVKEDDPERAAVRVEIDPRTVIRQGDVATLKIFGITGVAFINIEGANATSAPLVAEPGQDVPVIPSRHSDIGRLFQGIPEVMAQARELTERLSDLFNEENRGVLRQILDNVNELTAALAENSPKIEGILDSLDELSADLVVTGTSIRAVAERADTMLANVDGLLQSDGRALVVELRKAAVSFEKLSTEATGLLEESRDPLREFTSDGLNEFQRFLTEARLLVEGLSRVTERIESQGARFLFRDQADFTPQ